MPPTDRFVISFAAEPPQEPLPYGRWADTLAGHFRAAVRELDTEGEDIGEVDTEISWFPDRTYGGRTYVPAVARTSGGYRAVRVRLVQRGSRRARATSRPQVDFTSELAEANPDWKLDLNDEVIGSWRGEQGKTGRHDAGLGRAAGPRRRGRDRRAGQPRGRPVHSWSRIASR